jgi:pimeloyl-ACP methyl ester carboxylesterase
VTVDPALRPYIIIDPRAGHGPGIGGFKDDSQVGVALREGHPVYFVIFFRDPEPGQTLVDVCEAEKRFVREVRARHPRSEKPAIVGNCQGGWAAMMLAAADPDDTGPIVINGAPMSYWGGAWDEGAGDNPMRYAGGMLGGTWLASYASDIGDGVFDGAYLVENFESLNPANTFWDKYYHLYANVDTEPARFLDFERWWGGFYLMNREEIEWITRNLFVGNKLWTGGATGPAARRSTFARSARRSCCSRRWATTSRRRSRRSTGSPTCTARPTRSRRAGRSSSASCTRTSATSASSCRARSRRRSTRRSSRC